MQEQYKKEVRINPFAIGGLILTLMTTVLLVLSVKGLFEDNSYGLEIKIDNLSEEINDLPQDYKDFIYNQLYAIVKKNSKGDEFIPNSGAFVREGSSTYSQDAGVYYGNFIVDIPEIQQSYRVQFEGSTGSNISALGGYPVVVTCLEPELQIYDNRNCQEIIESSSSTYWDNRYQIKYTFGENISYKITDLIDGFLESLYGKQAIDVHVDETTLRQLKSQPDFTCQFNIVLSQGESFDVIVRIPQPENSGYIAMYINGDGVSEGFIATKDENSVTLLSNWLKQISNLPGLPIEVTEWI